MRGLIRIRTYTVTFFGHRYIDRFFDVEERVDAVVRQLIQSKEYVEFLVGRDGDFDQIVASVTRRAKAALGGDNSALVWVLPYPKTELKENEPSFTSYYDEIEVCAASASAHPKAAIQIRNRNMVDRADLVVCYVDHTSGGAYQALQYAKGHDKIIINLAEEKVTCQETF